MKKIILLLILPAFYLIFLSPALAHSSQRTEKAPLMILSDDSREYQLGHFLEILEDPSGALTIDQVSSAKYFDKFKASNSEIPNFGLTRSAYWARFKIKSLVPQHTDWLLKYSFPNIHNINFYSPHADDPGFDSINTGMLHPFDSRDINHTGFIFRLPPVTEEPLTIYLRLETDTNLTLPLTILSANTFISNNLLTYLLHGLFFGILLVMFGHYGFISLTLKDANYFYLFLFAGSAWMFQFTWEGYSSRFFWPNSPWLNDTIMRLFLSTTFISLILLTMNFLKTRSLPILHWGLFTGFIAWCLMIVLIPFSDYGTAINVMLFLILFSASMILITAITAFIQDKPSALFFLVGCCFFQLSGITTILARQGLIPNNIFTLQLGYQAGMIILVVFLSLSLSNKIHQLKLAHERARNDVLQAARKHEKLITDKNAQLELEMEARTRELILAHNIINESPAVAFLWSNNENWPVEYVSKNVIDLTGYSAEEFTSGKMTYKDIIHPEDYARVRQEVIDYSDATDFNHQSYRIITQSGNIKWLDDHTNILRNEHNEIINYQGIVIDVSEREIAKQELLKKQLSLNFLAHHDALTNLPNRLQFNDCMQRSLQKAKANHTQLALLFIDLDNFKPINDKLGHEVGDEVLKMIAERLIKSVRREDIVARLGGDEFVILLEDISELQDAARVADNIIKNQQPPFYINDQKLNITLSIGISTFPADGADCQTLIKNADIAMYRAKQSAPDTYTFYTNL